MSTKIFDVLPSEFNWNPNGNPVVASARCKACGAAIPLEPTRRYKRGQFFGFKCPSCPEGQFFGACTSHGGGVGIDSQMLAGLYAGETMTCPEPTCGATLGLPNLRPPLVM
jgi:hypothetical protein